MSSLHFYWPIYLDGTIVESGVYDALINALFAKTPTESLLEQLTGQYKQQMYTRVMVRSAINKLLTNSPIPKIQGHKLFDHICSFGDNSAICKRDFAQFIRTVEPKFGPVSFNVFESLLKIDT